ncbi:MAG TPA: RagB/SusD family nutrient uptake outer membrane protein [Chitinophagaceae bacterium]|nr:RagB/SusD family nutrient uptake outer membrane protein [Chitinophagaceae bacterium]
MKYTYKSLKVLVLAVMLFSISCTKLDENIYSNITADNFYHNRQEVLSAVLRPFTHARAWAAMNDRHGYWRLQELTADQQAWPQKGRHGYDGAQWIRQHYHEWTLTDRSIEEPWELIYAGISFCNVTINDLAGIDFPAIGMTEEEKASFIAESKVIRAWHYLKLIDLYGNVPIVTEVSSEPTNPPTKTRSEVFDFVEKELKDNVDLLPKLSGSLVGRVSQAAGYAMLAELYINAQIWKGTPKWDECIAACDKIMSGDTGGLNGPPALETDVMAPFSNANQKAKENIFQIAYDYKASGDAPGYPGVFWHYRSRQIYNAERDGNNEFVVTPNAFDSYKDNDIRKKEWFLFGLQKKDPALRTTVADSVVLGTEEYNGKPLIFVNNIRRNSEGETGPGGMTRGEENSGARLNKYRPGSLNDANYLGNDFVVYRLTEIYLFKAEAIMRKNGNAATQAAVDLVNSSKQRYFSPADWISEAYTTATLTLDELLAERGREFVFEGKRRADMIRFGTFTTASWWDHNPTTPTKALFCIPQKQLAANPNLRQNEGY